MSRTALKKSILLVLSLVLLIVLIVQISMTGRTKITELSVKKDIDRVEIEKNSVSIVLEKVNDKWIVSSNDYADEKCDTEEYSVSNILDSISFLRLIGTVSNGSEKRSDRYGLNDESKITVKAYGKNALLRTLDVGKNSSSGAQSYVRVDGKKSVMIADSALHSVFDKTFPSLRKKTLYSISSDSISAVSVKKGEAEFELMHSAVELTDTMVANQLSEWTVAKYPDGMEDVVLDQGTVGTWVVSLAQLDVTSWCEKDETLPEKSPDIEMKIEVGGMTDLSLNMYSDDDGNYICSSNQATELFILSSSTVESFAKSLADLLVKFEIPQIES